MTTRLSIDLTENLYRRLKIHCAMENKRIVEVVRRLIEDHLDKAEKKPRK